jgi:hypothetical protein
MASRRNFERQMFITATAAIFLLISAHNAEGWNRSRIAEASPQTPAPGRYKILSESGEIRIPFEIYRNKIRMTANVNGRDCRLTIDNGSLWNEILFFGSPETDALNFRYTGETVIGDASAPNPVRADTAPNVTIGFKDVVFTEQTAVVTRYEPGRLNMWEGIDGQVSATFFKNFIVKINFDESVIELFRPEDFVDPRNGQILAMKLGPNDSRTIRAVVRTTDGVDTAIDFLIDLGGLQPVYLPIGKYDSIRLPQNAVETSLGAGLRNQSGSLGRIRSITLGRHVLTDVVTAFTPVAKDASIFGNTMIGQPLLMKFLVTFDYPGNRLILERSRSFSEPFKVNMTGMELVPDSLGGLQVTKIYPRSAADEAAIKEGAFVTRINGKTISEYKPGEIRTILSQEGSEVRIEITRAGRAMKAIALKLRQIF